MQQTLILKNLLENEAFARKTIPYIKAEYFEDAHKFVFNEIFAFVEKYNKIPTPNALMVEFENSTVPDHIFTECGQILDQLVAMKKEENEEWLLDSTEEWCQERALELAVVESAQIVLDKKRKNERGKIMEMLNAAQEVSFNTSLGHDFFDDAGERFEHFLSPDNRIPFRVNIFNTATGGGIKRKTLNMLLAGTNVGKTMTMCHLAADYVLDGLNVLYISCEMRKEDIAQRIDANLLGIDLDNIMDLSKEAFVDKLNRIKEKSGGKLIVEEYPEATAHAGHFRALIRELKHKRKFVPDIILVDYLGICASSRATLSMGTNTFQGAISQELRGLAKETNTAIWSGAQLNRDGQRTTDFELTDIAEANAINNTADLIWGMSADDDMIEMNQIQFKNLKSRYSRKDKHLRFFVGVDRSKMKFYDLDNISEQAKNNYHGFKT